MTTLTRVASDARYSSHRNGLRLVASLSESTSGSAHHAENPAVPCLVLLSALGEKTVVHESALFDLFSTLRSGERIEFHHNVHRDEFGSAVTGRPYSLQIRVAATPTRLVDLKARVAAVFSSALPGFYFVEDFDLSAAADLCHVSQFALSGVFVTQKPLPRMSSADWNDSPTLSKLMNSGLNQDHGVVVPFPSDLPSWGYSAPFDEPLCLPASTDISIRIHGFALDNETCESLHRTLVRIQSGNLSVFHPASPIAAYSVATQMHETTCNLLRQWLQHPKGFAVDCVVRSSEPLSSSAQTTIVGDIFGKRPFQKVRSFDSSLPQELAVPEFAWAITRGQGLPALVPTQSVRVSLAIPRHYAAPMVPPPSSGILLGMTVCGRRSSTVSLPFQSRSRHVAVLGATGSGKSSLFAQMMMSDVADPNRSCGIGLIDPHGGLYQRVLEMIPPDRADDVILVDTSDPHSTACLNPLEGIKDDPMYANTVVSDLMSMIDQLFEGQDTSGPMLRSNLRNLLLLTTGTPGRHPCILDAVQALEVPSYAEYLMAKTKHRNVRDYWSRLMKSTGSENGYASWTPYLMARLTPFVSSPIMKRLLNRPDSTIDLGQAMQTKKIVLFNLNKGVLSDAESQVLGSIILSKFFAAALGRATMPEEQRSPFHLYVDEFSSFSNDSTPRLFSESRKFGLFLQVALQSLSQLENRWGRSNVADSLLGNVGTRFIMRLGPPDASTLAPYFQPQFDSTAMMTLPDFHAVASMTDNNQPIPPFVFKVNLATPDPIHHVPVQNLEDLSRRRYCVPVEQANRELSKLFDLDLASLEAKPKKSKTMPEHLPTVVEADDAKKDSPLAWGAGLMAKWRATDSVAQSDAGQVKP